MLNDDNDNDGDEYCDDDDINDDGYDDSFARMPISQSSIDRFVFVHPYNKMTLFAAGRTSAQPLPKIARVSWAP